MQRYIVIRLFQGFMTLLVVSLVVFILSRLSGDPVSLLIDPEATKVEVAELKAQLGLDKSYPKGGQVCR